MIKTSFQVMTVLQYVYYLFFYFFISTPHVWCFVLYCALCYTDIVHLAVAYNVKTVHMCN